MKKGMRAPKSGRKVAGAENAARGAGQASARKASLPRSPSAVFSFILIAAQAAFTA
jgi:hypothetical protein